mmetsp:Transcript_30445/g.90236  ORF Transcript_30445/g.90236 Transcript_30445/m.90236 type:complete len:229 (+) Transcript_30445:1021-1707(+)
MMASGTLPRVAMRGVPGRSSLPWMRPAPLWLWPWPCVWPWECGRVRGWACGWACAGRHPRVWLCCRCCCRCCCSRCCSCCCSCCCMLGRASRLLCCTTYTSSGSPSLGSSPRAVLATPALTASNVDSSSSPATRTPPPRYVRSDGVRAPAVTGVRGRRPAAIATSACVRNTDTRLSRDMTSTALACCPAGSSGRSALCAVALGPPAPTVALLWVLRRLRMRPTCASTR